MKFQDLKTYGKKNIATGLMALLLSGFSVSASALDVVIIIDTTGSTGALLPTWKANMEELVINPIKEVDPNARFGLASHADFPFTPYGDATDYPYRLAAPLDNDLTMFMTALNGLSSAGGYDVAESQLEAIVQANSGAGLDLNGNGSFLDAGDIAPSNMGFNPVTPSFTIHFTAPLVFHNDPEVEINYPYAGVVNHPADMNAALNAMNDKNNTYFVMIPDSLGMAAALKSSDKRTDDAQFGYASKSLMPGAGTTAAEVLAASTGGKILHVGADMSGLEEAVTEIIDIVRPCPKGELPVELPWGVVCVPEGK